MSNTLNHSAILKRYVFPLLLLAIAGGALALRLPVLDNRPMHGDEAVNATKFRDLYDHNAYRYDPDQYHGPSLYYLTLSAPLLSGRPQWLDIGPIAYRLPIVVCGLLLILALPLVSDGLGRPAVLFAALFTAVSPAFAFYSRYFIHEVPLILFTFGAIATGWQYARHGHARWAIACGACIGLMHATKETFVINGFAAVMGLGLALMWETAVHRERARPLHRLVRWELLAGVAAGAVVSVVLFSSVFTNARGPIDSIETYWHYYVRAKVTIHSHPWWYYFQALFWNQVKAGPVWTELLIGVLALAGAAAALSRRGINPRYVPLARFLVFYTLILTGVYTYLTYKTPWNALGFLHGMVLLAGVGAVALIRAARPLPLRVVVVLLVLAGAAHLVWLARQTNFVYYCDARNPHFYGHPAPDVVRVPELLESVAKYHPDGRRMLVFVVQGENIWPLPWYLRRFERVNYVNAVPPQDRFRVAGVATQVAVLIVPHDVQDFSEDSPYHDPMKYVAVMKGLRPGEPLVIFTHEDIWRPYVESRTVRPAKRP